MTTHANIAIKHGIPVFLRWVWATAAQKKEGIQAFSEYVHKTKVYKMIVTIHASRGMKARYSWRISGPGMDIGGKASQFTHINNAKGAVRMVLSQHLMPGSYDHLPWDPANETDRQPVTKRKSNKDNSDEFIAKQFKKHIEFPSTNSGTLLEGQRVAINRAAGDMLEITLRELQHEADGVVVAASGMSTALAQGKSTSVVNLSRQMQSLAEKFSTLNSVLPLLTKEL